MCASTAALVIQGSASVYSKKVEYLHSLVYSASEAIAKTRQAVSHTWLVLSRLLLF